MSVIFSKRHANRKKPLEFAVMTVDVPNLNGRVYSKACMIDVLRKFALRKNPMMSGFSTAICDNGLFNIEDVSHIVEKLEMRRCSLRHGRAVEKPERNSPVAND